MRKFRLLCPWQAIELTRAYSAAQRLSDAMGVEIEIDSDTQNEPGTPPFSDTTFARFASATRSSLT